jgi:hypothetical protein
MQEIVDEKSGIPPERIAPEKEAPGSKSTQVRRTRGSAPHKAGGANGQRTDGQAVPAAEHDRDRGAHGQSARLKPNGDAASDDASGLTAAMAQNSAAAGTDRFACADVAEPSHAKVQAGTAVQAGPCVAGEDQKENIPPGSEALPEDGMTFVDAMHERIDLWEVGKKLMQNGDAKIVQRAWERMLEMKYGKGPSAPGDEVPQIIFDTPRPIRD